MQSRFLVLITLWILVGCQPPPPRSTQPTLVVTYSVLGALVKDLVGDHFRVEVPLPNGLDVHEWEPSARDIETFNHATLIVRNGLGLEGGMEGVLAQAATNGIPEFTAAEHLPIRTVKAAQGLPNDDPDQAPGAADPHIWLDPRGMKQVILALALELKTRFGVNLDERAENLAQRLTELDNQLKTLAQAVPADRRQLVTGHESLGYFADAYGFTLVGALVPSLTTQAEVSARDMLALKAAIQGRHVSVLFTELGTPPKVAQALASELGLRVVEISTHVVPDDGSYFTLMTTLAQALVAPLRP